MNRAELIRNLHRRLDAAASLSPRISARIDEVMQRYIDTLARIETGEEPGSTVEDVDFPDFVADLILGTFEAIVDATIQQMNAYGDLLEEVTGSIDRFIADNIGDSPARDYLTEVSEVDFEALLDRSSKDQYEDCEKLKQILARMGIRLAMDCPPSEKQLAAIREALGLRSRQKMLATMVLTGINRIVVSGENRKNDA